MNTLMIILLLLLVLGIFVIIGLVIRWIIRSIVKYVLRVAATSDNKSSQEKDKFVLPLKIQAYERIMLYLGRIRPQSLVKRVFSVGMSRDDFHLSMIQSVSDEFEHNLTQRLYVSSAVWKAVENAKEELLAQINAAFDAMPDELDTSLIAQMLVSVSVADIDHAAAMAKREFDLLTEGCRVK